MLSCILMTVRTIVTILCILRTIGTPVIMRRTVHEELAASGVKDAALCRRVAKKLQVRLTSDLWETLALNSKVNSQTNMS